MRRTPWVYGVLTAMAAASGGSAQTPATRAGVLTGTVYDSLTRAPVAGAEILVDGGSWRARADARGRFAVGVPEGDHQVTFTRRGVSSWSALRHPAGVRVEPGDTIRVSLATASPATVLARACGGGGAVVGGMVRDMLTLAPLAAAQVYAKLVGAGGKSRMVSVRTDGGGSYSVCAAADEATTVELRAHFADAQSRTVTLADGDRPVRTRDLFIRTSEPAQVAGQVLDGQSGDPVADATVELLGTRLRTVSRADGRFLFRGVPPGAVSIAIERIGYGRRVAQVTVRPGDIVDVTVEVFTEAISLDSMVVSVAGRPVDERVRMGTRFDGLTRPEIERLLPRSVQFDDLLRNANVPGLRISEVLYQDQAGSRTPGLCVETGRRSRFRGNICEMVEVYLNDVRVGDAEVLLRSLDPATIERFQILSRVEAGVQYSGTPRARNGVLLIWTRGR